MPICIVAATSIELEALSSSSTALPYDLLITGPGTAATVYHLMKKINTAKPSLIIQAGIAGSFDGSIPLGAPLVIRQDRFADLGVHEHDQWKDIFDLNLEQSQTHPYKNGWLPNPHADLLNILSLPKVSAATINEVTTSSLRIRQYREKYDPAIESMEGAAFHYVCLREGIPFIQVRTISNYVGERDKSRWQIKQAILNLGLQVQALISRIA